MTPEPLIPVDAERVRDVLARHERRRAYRMAAFAILALNVAVWIIFAVVVCWQGFPP